MAMTMEECVARMEREGEEARMREVEREAALESLADASEKLHCSTRQKDFDACLKWCRKLGIDEADINEAIEAGK